MGLRAGPIPAHPLAVLLGILLGAAMAWSGPAEADPAEADLAAPLRVLELDGQRWRAVGTLRSSVTGAELVIFEEETTRRSKIARRDSILVKGVTVRAVSDSEVLLEVAGRPARLAIARGIGAKLGTFKAPAAPESKPSEAKLASAPPAFSRVQLTLAEFLRSAQAVREALRAGDIAPGHNAHGVFGLKINESPPGSLTERLGLLPGDVVVAVNGKPAATEEAAVALLDAAAPDQSIPFAFRRGEEVGQGVVEIVAEE